MTKNMITELDNLTERATHADTMKFSPADAERLTYLEMANAIYQEERKAIAE